MRYCLLGAVPLVVAAVAVRFVLGIRRIIVFQVRWWAFDCCSHLCLGACGWGIGGEGRVGGCRCVTLCCILRRSLLIFCCLLVYFSQQHFFLTFLSAQNRNVNQASNRYKCTDTDTDTEINTHRYRWAQVSRVHCISCRGSRSRLENPLRLLPRPRLRLSSMQLFALVADNILRSSRSFYVSLSLL